jgi:hypothetical protein
MPKYDSKLNAPIQLTSRKILKVMYNPPPLEEVYHIGDPKPDAPKEQLPWTVESLAEKLKHGQDAPLTMVREAVEMLQRASFVEPVQGGYDLTGGGKREAERLEAKPIQRSASG